MILYYLNYILYNIFLWFSLIYFSWNSIFIQIFVIYIIILFLFNFLFIYYIFFFFLLLLLLSVSLSIYQIDLFLFFLWLIELPVIFCFFFILIFFNNELQIFKKNKFNLTYFIFILLYYNKNFFYFNFISNLFEDFFESNSNFISNDYFCIFVSIFNFYSIHFFFLLVLFFICNCLCINIILYFYNNYNKGFFSQFLKYQQKYFKIKFLFIKKQNFFIQNQFLSSIKIFKKK